MHKISPIAIKYGQGKVTLSLRKKCRCSLTVKRSNSMLCWGQTPKLLRIWLMLVRISDPLIVADPLVGVYRPREEKDGQDWVGWALLWYHSVAYQLGWTLWWSSLLHCVPGEQWPGPCIYQGRGCWQLWLDGSPSDLKTALRERTAPRMIGINALSALRGTRRATHTCP